MAHSTKGRKFPPELLTAGEVQQLLHLCNPRYPTGLRNRALLVTLVRSGPRIHEALALEVGDIDFDLGQITIRRGKGGKRRVIGIDQDALTVVRQWAVRRATLPNPTGAFFCSLRGTPLSTSYANNWCKRLQRKSGIGKRIHPHLFRHQCASQAALEGVPLVSIQRQLGHHSISTTDRYLRAIQPVEAIGVFSRRSWAA